MVVLAISDRPTFARPESRFMFRVCGFHFVAFFLQTDADQVTPKQIVANISRPEINLTCQFASIAIGFFGIQVKERALALVEFA